MPSINATGRRFESIMVKETGVPFYGTIEPNQEGRQSTYDMSEARQILRVDHLCPATSGDIVMDIVGRRFILADHDIMLNAGHVEYRTHRMYPANTEVLWEREASVIDPLTQRQRSVGKAEVGRIWALVERLEREFNDPGLQVKEERKRIMLGQPVELGDILDNMVVRRIDPALGIYIAEVQ